MTADSPRADRGSGGDRDRWVFRAGALTGLLLLLFGALLVRFFDLMVLRHAEMRDLARGQLRVEAEVPARRGTIRDRRGRELALTRGVPSVAVDPSAVPPADREAVAAHLAKTLELEPAFVRDQLGKDCRFRWLLRHIREPRMLEKLPTLDRRVVIVRQEPARVQPAGRVGAQLIGFTDRDGRGLAGLELVWDRWLRPRPGQRTLMRDGRAGLIRMAPGEEEVRECEDGCDLELAMDLTIQTFTEEALDRAVEEWRPASAVAVVMDPMNGDVLAMAGRPTFDPDDRSTAAPETTRVRAVTDCFEVGSVMKPLMAAGALDRGTVSLSDTIDCTDEGAWVVRVPGRRGSRLLHDHHPIGKVPFPEVLIKSSNIGMARVALGLGVDEAYRHYRILGFGQTTGSMLPGEVPGIMTARSDWDPIYTLPSVAMGRELAVTPLQFAAAFCTLANGGVLFRPRVVRRVGDRELPPWPLREVVRPEVTGDLLPILERVVTEGTGKRARLPGYRVAGKTGTAELRVGGQTVGYNASFVAFAPAEAPRFLVYVLLERPRLDREKPFGGTCAAPCVKEILANCLGYAEVRPTAGGRAPASGDLSRR